jgi:hypothetical protein
MDPDREWMFPPEDADTTPAEPPWGRSNTDYVEGLRQVIEGLQRHRNNVIRRTKNGAQTGANIIRAESRQAMRLGRQASNEVQNRVRNGANVIRSGAESSMVMGQRTARHFVETGQRVAIYVVCGTTIVVVSAAGISLLAGAAYLGAAVVEAAVGSVAGTVTTVAAAHPYGCLTAVMVGTFAGGAGSEQADGGEQD